MILPLDEAGPGLQGHFTELTVSGSSGSRTPGWNQCWARVALRSRTSWESRLLPTGTHPVPSLGSVAVWGSCPMCRDVQQRALRTGSCLQSCEEPCEQVPGSQAESQATDELPVELLGPQTAPFQTHATTLCTDLQ